MTRKHRNTQEAADANKLGPADPLAIPDDPAPPTALEAIQKLPGDAAAETFMELAQRAVDAAVAEERVRCAEIARTVGMRPESYADRLGPDAIGDAIARHIESGMSMAHIAGNLDDAT